MTKIELVKNMINSKIMANTSILQGIEEIYSDNEIKVSYVLNNVPLNYRLSSIFLNSWCSRRLNKIVFYSHGMIGHLLSSLESEHIDTMRNIEVIILNEDVPTLKYLISSHPELFSYSKTREYLFSVALLVGNSEVVRLLHHLIETNNDNMNIHEIVSAIIAEILNLFHCRKIMREHNCQYTQYTPYILRLFEILEWFSRYYINYDIHCFIPTNDSDIEILASLYHLLLKLSSIGNLLYRSNIPIQLFVMLYNTPNVRILATSNIPNIFIRYGSDLQTITFILNECKGILSISSTILLNLSKSSSLSLDVLRYIINHEDFDVSDDSLSWDIIDCEFNNYHIEMAECMICKYIKIYHQSPKQYRIKEIILKNLITILGKTNYDDEMTQCLQFIQKYGTILDSSFYKELFYINYYINPYETFNRVINNLLNYYSNDKHELNLIRLGLLDELKSDYNTWEQRRAESAITRPLDTMSLTDHIKREHKWIRDVLKNNNMLN